MRSGTGINKPVRLGTSFILIAASACDTSSSLCEKSYHTNILVQYDLVFHRSDKQLELQNCLIDNFVKKLDFESLNLSYLWKIRGIVILIPSIKWRSFFTSILKTLIRLKTLSVLDVNHKVWTTTLRVTRWRLWSISPTMSTTFTTYFSYSNKSKITVITLIIFISTYAKFMIWKQLWLGKSRIWRSGVLWINEADIF